LKTIKATGWLLDVYISDDKAFLWFKLENGQTIRLEDTYTPDFYIQLKEDASMEEIKQILSSHPHILRVILEKKFTSVDAGEMTGVLHILVDSSKNFRRVIYDIEKLGFVKAYYNIDVLHVQRYLFQKSFAPTSKITIKYTENEWKLQSATILNDEEEIAPPPFKTAIFEMGISSENLTPQVKRDAISKIIVLNNYMEATEAFDGDEKDVLLNFSEYVIKEDPDFLISTNVEGTLRYILERAKIQGLKLKLGREEADLCRLKRLIPYAHKGRVSLDLNRFLETGIAGVVERSRFTFAPPGLSAKWPAGRIIDSHQCFEALKKGILLPRNHGFFRYMTTAKETLFRDRGSLILSPKVGIHENVEELDFESMFPHIIIKHNISCETVKPKGIDESKKGFLGELTQKYLKRRLYFKHLRKRYPQNSREWLWCDQRQTTLKGILVCIYGYSGCFANRFSNVLAYEEINKIARNILIETMNIALSRGFEVIYADSDSIFVKRRDASEQDYKHLAEMITNRTGLPIASDHHYKFLVLLTQEADPNLEATRRYFGKLTNGELYFKGIELRRRDYPPFIKDFQMNLIKILLDADKPDDVENKQFKKAVDYVIQTSEKVREGKINIEQLVISKILRKPVNEYRSLFPHVIAAIQEAQKGKKHRIGEKIDFWYVHADHVNPFRRVVSASIMDDEHRHYDVDKYVEMVLDAAETILGTFSFKRSNLGFQPKPKGFLQELCSDKEEILAHLQSLENQL
jgi:DNA polymerase-2